MTKKAVIIGAGYGGLALANLLALKAVQVAVYEKNPSAGGRIQVVKQMALRLILAHRGI